MTPVFILIANEAEAEADDQLVLAGSTEEEAQERFLEHQRSLLTDELEFVETGEEFDYLKSEIQTYATWASFQATNAEQWDIDIIERTI